MCNRTSDDSIATNPGETVSGHFHFDPRDSNSIYCDDCATEIGILISEYYADDDPRFNYAFRRD